MKVVLVVPNLKWSAGDKSIFWDYIPYNLCMIASMIKDICDITIIDLYKKKLSRDGFSRMMELIQPDIVGISIMMDQFADVAHETARIVKNAAPGSIIVMGGVHVTVSPETVMDDKNIDYAVVGEGEYAFRDLVESLSENSSDRSVDIKGVWYRQKDKVIQNDRTDYILNLDELPLPSYDLIDFQEYATSFARKSVGGPRKLPYARVFTSRGCPQKCSFCQVKHIAGRKFRPRSVANILDEIDWLKSEYGVQNLIFDDDNLFTNRKRAFELFSGMIERKLVMPWSSISTAVFHLDEELVRFMKRSGCYFVNIAIESGSKRVLKEIVSKPVNYDHAEKMVIKLRAENIFVAANFIIGFPTETWDEILETISFAEQIDVDYVKIFHAIPLKNTKLWDICVATNAFKPDFDIQDISWHLGQIQTTEFNPNDLTILRAYEWDRINFSNSGRKQKIADEMSVSLQELNKIRRDTLNNAQLSVSLDNINNLRD